jgi:hypothetical protein
MRNISLGLCAAILAACNLSAPQTEADQLATIVAGTLTALPTDVVPTPVQTFVFATSTPASSSTPAPTIAPSETPSLTPELTSTASQTPLHTPTPSDPDLPSGEPDWEDHFDSAGNWPLYRDDYVNFEVKDGNAVMTAFKPESWDGWMLTWPQLSDFYLEATFISGSECSGLDRYGLVARQSKSEDVFVGYLLGLSCDGRYNLRSWDGEAFTHHVPWTVDDRIKTGPNQTHSLGFFAQGDRLVIYLNGMRLHELTDATFDQGQFGLFISSASTDDFEVAVDRIAYWSIP